VSPHPHQPSNNLSLEHFSYEALQTAKWEDFERFTIEVLKRYYEPLGLSIARTEKRSGGDIGSDGSRDGEGTVVFGGSRLDQSSTTPRSLATPTLGVLITLWVEVKKRSSKNINHHDVGGTIFRSSLEYVTKIVFVSNRGFTSQFKKDLERHALQNGKQFGLIDGRTLIQVAERVVGPKSDTKKRSTARFDIGHGNSLTVTLRITTDSTVRHVSAPHRIERSIKEPVFIVADCAVAGSPSPYDLVRLHLKHRTPTRVSITARSGVVQNTLAAGEHFRTVFAVFPNEPQQLTLRSFSLSITDAEGRPVKAVIKRGPESCQVHGTILPETMPTSRLNKYRQLRSELETWLKSSGSGAVDLVAIAGAGKSHSVRELRAIWLSQGVYEVFLDGANEQTADAVALSLLAQVFPIPLDEVTEELSAILADWLTKSGLPEGSSTALARHLCRPDERGAFPFNMSQLGDVLALILTKRAETSPIILVFEDLHKCLPSTIGLLRSLRSSLANLGGSRVFTLFTTREDSVWNDDAVRSEWRASMETMRVGNDVPQFQLTAFTRGEALALISEAIPTIEQHYAEAIVDQVGTTPFAIREALGLLLELKILEPSNKNGVWRLTEPDALLQSIDSQRLRKATHFRLLGLRERHPDWLADFLDSGACLGNTFDVEICLRSAPGAKRGALEKAIGECRLLEVLRSSTSSPSELQFDHDLIRRVLLQDMGSFRQRRIARGLFEESVGKAGNAALASLAYQAGLGNECWSYSLKQADTARNAKRHMEAAHALGLALTVTDQNVAAIVFDVQEGRYKPSFDEAIAVAEQCTREELGRLHREQETAELLLRYVEHLVAVGSGGSPSIDRALTEGQMLAERLKDKALRATLKMYQGRQEFNSDRPHQSLKLHEESESMFAGLKPSSEVSSRRAQNLVRLAIAYRQTGQLDESRATLIRSLRERGCPDWSLATQVRANLGATYFYLDWDQTRHHWSRALRIADSHSLPDRKVHSLIDVAHLDLLNDKLEAAGHQLEEALLLSRDYGLENSELRCLLNLGCLELMRGDPAEALDLFRKADRLGFRHGIGRRLWRVRANMATTYFVLGDADRSLATDKITLSSMPSLEGTVSLDERPAFSKTRLVLALANMVLRAKHSAAHQEMTGDIPEPILAVAKSLAKSVVDDRLDSLPGLRGRHCKKLSGESFFIITE
jgi:tetratricopeptide (TPR) repeat protein